MASLTTRAGKGSPLTNNELDANFNNLNAEVTPSRPTVRPSLLLDFAQTKQLDPRITFSRASTASYYDGKSVVKAEENLLSYSQDYSNGFWGNPMNVSLSGNAATAPDGTQTAGTLYETATAGNHFVGTSMIQFVSGQQYTFSFYAKNVTGGRGVIGTVAYGPFASGAYAFFDVVNGCVASTSSMTASIVNVGNGWYRCIATTTATSTAQERFYFMLTNGTYTQVPSYTGDVTKGFYVWGAQLEQRAYATAYTPTTSSAITNYIPALQTAASGTARFDHDPVTGESKGLLIEEQRSNLNTYSSDFAFWGSSGASVYSDCIIAPDGTRTADKVVESSGGSLHIITQGPSITLGGTYTFSCYAKAGERRWVVVQVHSAIWAYVDLSTGTLGITNGSPATSITNVGNGWYRISVSGVAPYANASCTIYLANGNGSVSYTGDGVSGLYIWGAQLEAGAFATSYIPTPLAYTGRASTATYKAADGLIRIAGNDVARYEPNAAGGSNLLLEGGATNYFTDESGGIALVGGYSAGYSLDTAAPDGSYTATKYIWDKSTGSFYGDTSPGTINATNAGAYTYSVWMKIPAGKKMSIAILYSAGGNIEPEFVGTGRWERYSVTKTFGASDTGYIRLHPFMQRSPAASDAAQEVLIWGMQLEAGSAPTAYVYPTKNHTGRSSTATYYDSTGTIRTAASGQPRYTYNPSLLTAPPKLLLEAQATNVLTNSITTWPSGNIAYATGAATAPDGSTTALSWTESASYTYQRTSAVFPHTDGNVYTFSVYAKAGARDWVTLDYSPLVYFNLKTGQINAPVYSGLIGYGSVNVGNGWWRCWVTYQKDGFPTMYMGSSASGADGGLYTGSNAAPAIYTWGAQKEVGYAATSYIPTSGSSVTRAADTSTSAAGSRAADVYSSSQVTRSAEVASMTGTNFSSWYRADEGTLYATGAVGASTNYGPFFTAQVSGGSTRIQLTAGNAAIVSNGSASADMYASTTPNVLTSVSTAYKTNDYAFAKDGALVSQDSSGQVPQNLAYSIIGKFDFGGAQSINGTIKRIAYYPKRLSNSELQGLTS